MIEFGEFLLTPIFCVTYMTITKDYLVKPVHKHVQSIQNIILENKGKLPPKRVRLNCHYFVVLENR